jgi:hypothetical protein
VRCEAKLDHDWGTAAPAPGVAADRFSVRWTGRIPLPAGTHRFTETTDDGARLRIDGTTRIDRWTVGTAAANTADVRLDAGVHTVVLEYFDSGQGAVAKLRSARVGTAPVLRVTAPATRTRVAPGATVAFTATATDREDGALPASAVTVDVTYLHHGTSNFHVHPHQTTPGALSGSFVALGGHGPGHYRITARATDRSGWTATSPPVDVCLGGQFDGACA